MRLKGLILSLLLMVLPSFSTEPVHFKMLIANVYSVFTEESKIKTQKDFVMDSGEYTSLKAEYENGWVIKSIQWKVLDRKSQVMIFMVRK